jgi:hypothetical protein
MDMRVIKGYRRILPITAESDGYYQQEKQAALSVLHKGKYRGIGMSSPLQMASFSYITKKQTMFDQILQIVKEHLGNDPQVAQAIPADKKDAVQQEIAAQISNGLESQPAGGGGGLLGNLAGSLGGGGLLSGLMDGGLVNSLGSKFGLPPAAISAITAALPGLLQKIMQKTGKTGGLGF